LVYLHNNCIPKEVSSLMYKEIEEKYRKNLSASEIYTIMNKDKILEKTTYSKEKKTDFTESGIFNGIKQEISDVKIVEDKKTSFDNDFWNNLLK